MTPGGLSCMSRGFRVAAVAVALAGCAALEPPAPPPAAPAASLTELWQRPPERAFLNGLRAYEDGAFERAEASLRSALLQGLRDRRDAAVAHKFLAFIACAFNRIAECEQQFHNAFAADAGLVLSDAEIGHPIWGPVYRRVSAQRLVRAPGPARTESGSKPNGPRSPVPTPAGTAAPAAAAPPSATSTTAPPIPASPAAR